MPRRRWFVSVCALEVRLHLAAQFFGSAEGLEARRRVQLLVEPFYFTGGAVAQGKERAQRRPAVRQHMTGYGARGATKAGTQDPADRGAKGRAGKAHEEKTAAHAIG